MRGLRPSIQVYQDIPDHPPGVPRASLMNNGHGKAVVLLSGGLDSATTLAIAKSQQFLPYCLTFQYGQRHEIEIESAQQVARAQSVVRHEILEIDLRCFGGSALTDQIDVPKRDNAAQIGAEIPVTYVPARNTIFLSFAMAWAEVLEADAIFIGVNSLDYSGYPDCRPEFLGAFQKMAHLATKRAVEGGHVMIHAPLIELTKAEIIRSGLELGVDYSMTTSCYDPSRTGTACGRCDACLLRRKGFTEQGMVDPAKYVS